LQLAYPPIVFNIGSGCLIFNLRSKMVSIISPQGPAFVCKDEPIENFRPMKVRVIGAGFAGLYMGMRIPQRLRNIDFQIYEKNKGIGGTWWENRYPGESP
jgi:hypothetical protein